MDPIEEEYVNKRRLRLMAECQEYMAAAVIDKNNPIQLPIQTGQMAGRSVRQIDSVDSKVSRLYHNHAVSTREDQLLNIRINTAKRTESHISKKIDKSKFAYINP